MRFNTITIAHNAIKNYFSIELTLISFRKIPTLTKMNKPSNRTEIKKLRNPHLYCVTVTLNNGSYHMLMQEENPLNIFFKAIILIFTIYIFNNSTLSNYSEGEINILKWYDMVPELEKRTTNIRINDYAIYFQFWQSVLDIKTIWLFQGNILPCLCRYSRRTVDQSKW